MHFTTKLVMYKIIYIYLKLTTCNRQESYFCSIDIFSNQSLKAIKMVEWRTVNKTYFLDKCSENGYILQFYRSSYTFFFNVSLLLNTMPNKFK